MEIDEREYLINTENMALFSQIIEENEEKNQQKKSDLEEQEQFLINQMAVSEVKNDYIKMEFINTEKRIAALERIIKNQKSKILKLKTNKNVKISAPQEFFH